MEECFICMEEQDKFIVFPCKHKVCVLCFSKLKDKLCPMCEIPYRDPYNYVRVSICITGVALLGLSMYYSISSFF